MKANRKNFIIKGPILLGLVFGLVFSLGSEGYAKKKKKSKKQTIDFEDELVEGGNQKPELFYLLQKKSFNYKRLIRLRNNFLPEMRRTAVDVQRAGRSD